MNTLNKESKEMIKIIWDRKREGWSLTKISLYLMDMYPHIPEEKMFQKVRYLWSLIRNGSPLVEAREAVVAPTKIAIGPNSKRKNAEVEPKSFSMHTRKDGTEEKEFTDMITVPEGEPITPELVMKAHNLDETLWIVEHFTSNPWQAQSKKKGIVTLWQTKLIVRPKKPGEVTLEEVKRFYEKNRFISSSDVAPFRTVKNGKVLEVCLADLHMGLFSMESEVGENAYSIEEAKRRLRHCMSGIISANKGKAFEKIVFVTLGDVMHVDNSKQTTTNGTFQQIDTSVHNIYEESVNAVRFCIDTLLQLRCPVEYIYIPGNHDCDSGGHIALTIRAIYESNPNVTCDTSANPLKARLYGITLVGYHHGDCSKQNIGSMVPQNFPMLYAQAKYTKLKVGHLHHHQSFLAGVTSVEYQESPCGASLWEHQEGYGGPRGIRYCVYDNETGDTTEGCIRV